jgi:hypothetical protein
MEPSEYERMRQVIFDSNDESDEFTKKLSAAVVAIEAHIRPHLKL